MRVVPELRPPALNHLNGMPCPHGVERVNPMAWNALSSWRGTGEPLDWNLHTHGYIVWAGGHELTSRHVIH